MTSSITIKEYFAAAGSRFSDKDARAIGPVLLELSRAGDVTAADVVQAAQSSNSALHGYFEWDDAVAANAYREGQAHEIINAVRVRIVTDGVERSVRAYTVARIAQKPAPAPNKRITAPVDEEGEDLAVVTDLALRELQEWRIKYRNHIQSAAEVRDVLLPVLNQVNEFLAEVPAASKPVNTEAAIADLRQWLITHGHIVQSASDLAVQAQYVLEAVQEAEKDWAAVNGREISDPMAMENAALLERICELEGRDDEVYLALRFKLGLTPTEARIVGILLVRDFVPYRALQIALYAEQIKHDTIKTIICKLRPKLSGHGVVIHTKWGEGFEMDCASKDKLRGIIGLEAAA